MKPKKFRKIGVKMAFIKDGEVKIFKNIKTASEDSFEVEPERYGIDDLVKETTIEKEEDNFVPDKKSNK